MATSSNVRTIVPSTIPARSCSKLSPTHSRPRLRNCWQKTKQVLDQAGALENIEKHLQQQRELFHSFVDFKKAFDRVWHAGMWQVLRSFNIEEGLVRAIQALHENSSNAVLLNSQLGEICVTAVGVHQGYLLSPILFNMFLEKIM